MFQELTDDNFEAEVAKNEGPIIVDFWAPWCGPCRLMDPTVKELAEKYKGKIRFAKFNVDESSIIVREFNLFSIPTFLIFNNNVLVDTIVGAQSKSIMEKHIEAFTGKVEEKTVESKIIRIYMEHDDGSVSFLEGPSLDLWLKASESIAVNTFVRFGNTGFEDVIWQDLKTPITLSPKP
jgi:thioredoxin 1